MPRTLCPLFCKESGRSRIEDEDDDEAWPEALRGHEDDCRLSTVYCPLSSALFDRGLRRWEWRRLPEVVAALEFRPAAGPAQGARYKTLQTITCH